MKVNELIKEEEREILVENVSLDTNITTLSYDSRNDSNAAIFFATTEASTNGNNYLIKAIDAGYKILVTDKTEDELKKNFGFELQKYLKRNVTILKVKDSNFALALASERLNNFPANKMKFIGVTGTNGKTTTTSLIYEILEKFGHITGLIGTMQIHYHDEIEESKNTTPDAIKLQDIYNKMVDKGCEYNVMEVSSHSLSLKRICNEEFEVGVYTNLTEDHLDYHKTMENYRDAKALLFKKAKNCVINLDTEYSDFYINEVISLNKNLMLYGINKENDDEHIEKIKKEYKDARILIASNVQIDIDGSKFDITYIDENKKEYKNSVHIKTPGEFSVYNALGAIGTLLYLGIDLNAICEILKTLPGITGRFQTFVSKKGFGVAVDYAHTPDGLLNILNTARKFVKGRIITLFGCGGDRDKLKRPIMGKIVMELSDVAIVTSDNPRTEDPEKIIEDVEVGMKEIGKEYIKITDRNEAIKKAIEIAEEGDFVIIAGKGHEDYQIIGKEKVHFSDIENVMKLLEIK